MYLMMKNHDNHKLVRKIINMQSKAKMHKITMNKPVALPICISEMIKTEALTKP